MIFISYVLLGSVLSLVSTFESLLCPRLEGKSPFDRKRFEGEWYVITSTATFLGPVLYKCAVFSYINFNSGDGVYVLTAESAENKTLQSYTLTRPVVDEEHTSHSLAVIHIPNKEKWNNVHELVILDTDYDNFAVYFGCRQDFIPSTLMFHKKMYGSILSRKKFLSTKTMKKLKKLLAKNDIKETDLLPVDHSDCNSCREQFFKIKG